MVMFNRSARRGMIAGAAVSSSRAKKQAAAQQAQAPAPQPAPAASTNEAIEQIKKLAELKDQGILTDAEFEAKKKKLLGL